MPTMLIRALTLFSLLMSATALAETPRAPQVLVVVEAAQGLRVGAAVRRGLSAQLGNRIALVEAGETADAVITVTAGDDPATARVTVRYWDSSGRSDAVSLPLPSATARLEDVAATLAAVLLQRHVLAAQSPSTTDSEQTLEERMSCETCALARARPPVRRTFALALSDF